MTGLPDDVVTVPYDPATHDAPRGGGEDCQGFDDGQDTELPTVLSAALARLDEPPADGT